MLKLKGVAFDLEGTLIDVEKAHWVGHIFCAYDCGVDLLYLGENVKSQFENQAFADCVHAGLLSNLDKICKLIPHFIGGGKPGVVEEIYELSDKKKSIEEANILDNFYYKLILQNMEIMPRHGVIEAIEWFLKNGFDISIGSLTVTEEAMFLLKKSGIIKKFKPDRIILREDVRNLKPAPDVYLKTAEKMGVRPCEQIVFEDSPNGARAAKVAGSIAIGMPAYNLIAAQLPLLQAGADRIFIDWREINFKNLIFNLEQELNCK